MRVPAATYRLQLGRRLRLADALDLVPYLDALGITDLYLSPITRARQWSTHGYDVTDPNAIDPALGTEEELDALAHALERRGMGLVLDMVPNHMAASHENPWWMDVLRRGERSAFARVFDIDWARGRLLLPVLGDRYGAALERGDLQVKDGTLRYYDHVFPLVGARGALAGTPGVPRSWDRLDALLGKQPYRLAHWKTASPEINYRRFFDINDLVGVRVEDPWVFERTHALVLRLVSRGTVTGLRADHVDGLRDPQGYLERLRAACGPGIYLLVEKILTGDERLPAEWPVDGTTGYDWLKVANGIFADGKGVRDLEALYKGFTGNGEPFVEIVRRLKRRVLEELFPGELARLVETLHALADHDRQACDLGAAQLREALVLLTASLPVYRTYFRHGAGDAASHAVLERALREARARAVNTDAAAFDFLGRAIEGSSDLAARWQQLTGPVMAKGLEDTAFYVYTRLLSLNDIGARRSRARSLEDLHAFNRHRRERWPRSLNATSTHDTKRSEDVRARLHVISELAHEWGQLVPRWSRLHHAKKRRVHGALVPDPSEEMLLYQTLVGVWPLEGPDEEFLARVRLYLVKALREAKVHTSWTSPDEGYEEALLAFASAILEPSRARDELERFARRAAFYGALGSLAQVVLKVASPGVPDFYQGTELWSLALVDPDNRRPVDFALRERLLRELREGLVSPALLLERWRDGRVKLFVTSRALELRRERQALFLEGDYVPLHATGSRRQHVCAFARRLRGEWALAAVPRLLARVVPEGRFPLGKPVWPEGALVLPRGAPAVWRNVFTGEHVRRLALADVFRSFPVALLVS
jgi:(1->4)-alpha-D-glucan 1-alpha-D-glucosylmutase